VAILSRGNNKNSHFQKRRPRLFKISKARCHLEEFQMKRIVKEVQDWKKIGREILLSDNTKIISAQVKDDKADIQGDIEEGLCLVETKTGYFCRIIKNTGQEIGSNFRVMEQITFEQAFAEWKSKPIAFSLNKEISYLAIGSLENFGRIIDLCGTFGQSMHIDSIKQIAFDNGEIAFYQDESWHDLHLNVIPALMRMAEKNG
jgi:hypothetical protein